MRPLVACTCFGILIVVSPAHSSKIPVSAAAVTDAFGIDSLDQPATALFDEQSLAGDPLHGTGGKCNTSWNPGWQKDWYKYPTRPLAIVDLAESWQLSNLCMQHTWGKPILNISLSNAPVPTITEKV